MTWAGLTPPYSTIVVDPPWHYDKVNPDKDRERYRGGGLAYSSMTVEEISALSVGDVAGPDARLFLWTTNRYLRHSWGVLEAWGFEPQDRVLVWCKQPRCTTPVTTEFILIGKRGRPPRLPLASHDLVRLAAPAVSLAEATGRARSHRVLVSWSLRGTVRPPAASRLGQLGLGLRKRGGGMSTDFTPTSGRGGRESRFSTRLFPYVGPSHPTVMASS